MAFNLPNQKQKEDTAQREKELEEKRKNLMTPEMKEFINQSSFKESANVQAEIKTIQKQPLRQKNTNTEKENSTKRDTVNTPKQNKETKPRKKKNPEDLKTYKIDTYLPAKTYQKFIAKCEKEHRSQASMLRIIIMNFINKD